MHAVDLMLPDIAPLRPQDPVEYALERMEDLKVRHLPVVDRGRLAGMVQDDRLLDKSDERTRVSDVMDQVEVPFVREGQHLYDVMKLMRERGLTTLPVLDPTGQYLGLVDEHTALRRLAEAFNIHEPGSVLVLEMNANDYSLEHIARIVEGNEGKLLSVHTHQLPGSTKLEVTLKVNREDISAILRTFERFEYVVRSTYQGSKFHEDLRERYDELMRFMDL